MLTRILQFIIVSLGGLAILVNAGCAECAKGERVAEAPKPCPTPCEKVKGPCEKPGDELAAELPSFAKPGECYAKVFVPPQFKTVSERIMVKEASERIEIVPAKYEWVEERVCVKDASTRLVEIPAEYADRDVTVQTEQAHTDWKVTKDALCSAPKNQSNVNATRDVFCLVNFPSNQTTIHTQRLAKAATVREEIIPAQFETVRREKLVSAATTRKICIPAEFENVQKTVKVCDGRMTWQKVACEKPDDAVTINLSRMDRR